MEKQNSEVVKAPHRNALFWLFAALCVIGTIIIIVVMSRGQASANESVLLSVLLTILSVGAGWLITHFSYHQDRARQIAAIKGEYEASLELYAVKASEKVINLSNQVGRLISFVVNDDCSDSEDIGKTVDLLMLKNKSVTHMLETIKSMNDTSLSDWEGVISERLEAKRSIDEEREEEINETLELLRKIAANDSSGTESAKIVYRDIINELRSLSNTESSLPARRRTSTEYHCPYCANKIFLRFSASGRPKKKAITCSKCRTQLAVLQHDGAEPTLVKREHILETFDCPKCLATGKTLLDNVQNSSANFTCVSCDARLKIIRLSQGGTKVSELGVHAPKAPEQLSMDEQKLLEQVFMLLPEQPWPSGVHKDIASKLMVTNGQVSKAISNLIATGRVKNQIDGVVVNSEVAS